MGKILAAMNLKVHSEEYIRDGNFLTCMILITGLDINSCFDLHLKYKLRKHLDKTS